MPGGTRSTDALAPILDVCDTLLEEVGRREHRFSWLRDGLDWLTVDAYYPRQRVVVCCTQDPECRRRFEELIPQHGLRMVWIDPAEGLAGLRERLRTIVGSPRPSHQPAAVAATPGVVTYRTGLNVRAGFGLGLVLVAVFLAEAYLGIVVLAINAGDVVLGFVITLDAGARVIGTLAGLQRADLRAASRALLGGSPVLLYRRRSPSKR